MIQSVGSALPIHNSVWKVIISPPSSGFYTDEGGCSSPVAEHGMTVFRHLYYERYTQISFAPFISPPRIDNTIADQYVFMQAISVLRYEL